ncbi:hypothetical protein [Shewanella sp.]|uniref:hypothetical protein n=1 Tax=Shewanella sp. TaxID=50422 RepID=UPI003F6710A0
MCKGGLKKDCLKRWFDNTWQQALPSIAHADDKQLARVFALAMAILITKAERPNQRGAA